MDRVSEMSSKIKARAQERKEMERCKKYAIQLEGSNGYYTGKTVNGKKVLFDQCFGFSEQSKYGVGTLKVQDGEEWITIFTKGYPSKALEYMSNH